MKRTFQRFIKTDDQGQLFYEDTKTVHTHDKNNIEVLVRKRSFVCPTCGQPADENKLRKTCPVCQGVCCNFCHEERIRFHKIVFDQQIIIEKERRTWIESKLFDRFPMIGVIRRIVGMNSIRKLEDMRRRF